MPACASAAANWPGLAAQRLMDLHATPVVTPALAKRLKLEQPTDVVRAPMIHVSAFPLAWPEWLRQAGAGEGQARQTVWVDSFEAALQLAERGAGIALGLSPLFAERESQGRLCRPISQRYATGAYWLVHRPEEQANKALRIFKRWLTAELPLVERSSSQRSSFFFVSYSGELMLLPFN